MRGGVSQWADYTTVPLLQRKVTMRCLYYCCVSREESDCFATVSWTTPCHMSRELTDNRRQDGGKGAVGSYVDEVSSGVGPQNRRLPDILPTAAFAWSLRVKKDRTNKANR
ncbi:uncharacterized protein LOC117639244 [Thrips palmi]|uniref:Uncharacterized protein LOC117639244 n=1 Tax=Thrips palmi TaxID=161013 RepID=A0A6P8ZGS7_THRPL|nr:uncharacterized protein LOC117639244 [Thrips palmi]